jgi:ribosomal protein S17E
MLLQEESVKEISRELSQIYRKQFGRDPNVVLIRDEAENIVKKYGPVLAIKEIFYQDEEIS